MIGPSFLDMRSKHRTKQNKLKKKEVSFNITGASNASFQVERDQSDQASIQVEENPYYPILNRAISEITIVT